ncbi:TPA: restriction endonuclease subunit S [Vibrio vulnificus]
MSCNWPRVQISEVCELIVDCVNKTAPRVDYETPFKMIRTPNVKGGKISLNDCRFVEEDTYEKWTRRAKVLRDDVLLTREAPMGEVGIVDFDETVFLGQRIMQYRADRSKLDPHFLLYSFLSSDLQHQFNMHEGSGSVVSHIRVPDCSKFELNLPPLDVQKDIAGVLKKLDRKISVNQQTNQTLEQMAQAIFKSWFVDFDPVKAKMNGEQPEGMDAATASLFPEKLVSETGLPEGWKLSEIGDEVTVVGGGTPSKKNDDFWVDGHIHWTSPKDLSGVQDKVLLDTASKVTEAGLKKISSGLLPVDAVLLSSRAPVGYLALAKVPMAINQGYIAMKCEKQLPPEFVLQWCVHRMDEIKQRASGSTFAEISKKSFKPISVVVPTGEVLSAYQKLVKPLYDAITSNARQNEQLSSLRDTLLPKLLSGEIKLEMAKEQ